MLRVLETAALGGKRQNQTLRNGETEFIMGTVREYSMMFLVVEIKAREVTCPEERLLIYQQRDTGVGPDRRRFMVVKEDVELVTQEAVDWLCGDP